MTPVWSIPCVDIAGIQRCGLVLNEILRVYWRRLSHVYTSLVRDLGLRFGGPTNRPIRLVRITS